MKKKTAVILAVVLMVSLFVFTGCADDENALGDGEQGSASQDIAEGADDIGDGIEKGAEDIGDDLTGDNKTADDKVNDNDTTENKNDGSKVNN